MNWLRQALILVVFMGLWCGVAEARQEPSAGGADEPQAHRADQDVWAVTIELLTEVQNQERRRREQEAEDERQFQGENPWTEADARNGLREAQALDDASSVIEWRERLSRVLEQRGRHEEAEAELREAWSLRSSPDSFDQEPPLLLESFLRRQGRESEADLLFDDYVERMTLKALPPAREDAENWESLVDYQLSDLAKLLAERGRLAEAETLFRRGIALAELSDGDGSPDEYAASWRAEMLAALALAVRDQGRLDEAVGLFAEADNALLFEEQEAALLAQERAADEPSPWNLGLEGLYRAFAPAESEDPRVSNLEARFDLLVQLGRSEEARALYVGSDDASPASIRRFIATGRPRTEDMAVLLEVAASGPLTESQVPAFLRDALAIRRGLLPADHPDVLRTLSELAAMVAYEGDLSQAEGLLEELVGLSAEADGEDANEQFGSYGDPRIQLLNVLMRQGKEAEASAIRAELNIGDIDHEERALVEATAEYGATHWETLATTINLALELAGEGRGSEAEALLRPLIALTDPPLIGELASLRLAVVLALEGRLLEAETMIQETLSALRSANPRVSDLVYDALVVLINVLMEQNRFAEAELAQRELKVLLPEVWAEGDAYWAEVFSAVDGAPIEAGAPAAASDGMSTLAFELDFQLAYILHRQGGSPEAEELATGFLAHAERTYGPEHPTTTGAIGLYGRLLQDRGALAEAAPLLRQAVEIGLLGVCSEPEARRAAAVAPGEGAYRWNFADPACTGSPDFTENTARLAALQGEPTIDRPTAGVRLYAHASDMVLGRTRLGYMNDAGARSEFDRFRYVHADLVSAAWSASEAH